MKSIKELKNETIARDELAKAGFTKEQINVVIEYKLVWEVLNEIESGLTPDEAMREWDL